MNRIKKVKGLINKRGRNKTASEIKSHRRKRDNLKKDGYPVPVYHANEDAKNVVKSKQPKNQHKVE